MTTSAPAGTPAAGRTAPSELDVQRLLDAFTDVQRFVTIHNLLAPQPLPLLPWSFAHRHYDVCAELHDVPGALETLRAYAVALGFTVHERRKPARTVYSVRGHFPLTASDRRRPPTSVLIRLTVRHRAEAADGGAR